MSTNHTSPNAFDLTTDRIRRDFDTRATRTRMLEQAPVLECIANSERKRLKDRL